MEKPLFSIITVCYNSEETLRRTIQSVYSQKHSNIEYIIIDGNSSDNTLEIVKEYESKFENKLKWISEDDEGIYDAMNKGIEKANGEIIGIINSDDWYMKDALETVYKYYLMYPEADVFYGNIYKTLDGDKLLGEGYICFSELSSLRLNHPAMFVKKDTYNIVGKYRQKFNIGADRDFVIRALKNDITFVKINKVISNFSLEGISNDYSKLEILRDRINEEKKILDENSIGFVVKYKILFKKFITSFINYFITTLFGENVYKKYLKFKFKIKK